MLKLESYIFLSLFAVVSVIHLFFAFIEDEQKRKITKPLSLLFLALFAVLTLPTHPLIYIGAFFGMIGDIFLINNKDNKFFMIGAIFFLVGHLFYISEVLFVILKDNPVHFAFYIATPLAIVVFTIGGFFVSRKICDDKRVALIGTLYLAILLTVTAVAVIASVKGFLLYMVLAIIGGVFFLASDLILTQATYIKDFKRRDFYIMLTYLLGQVLIVTGLLFTLIF